MTGVRVAAGLAALVAAPAAGAASFSFTLNTASPLTAPGVTLTGDDQAKTFTMQYTVAYTGNFNSAGWKVMANAAAPTSGSNTLPALQVTNVTSACAGSCTTNPTNSVVWPVTMSATDQRIFNAAANTGRGTFTLTATWSISYPANALPGTYSTTVTLTGSTGP